ncbi:MULTISPECIES: hypothetical protein [Streptomyces]|uniref:hypothetical protein n=1 Tax=Streptomyces TaxID=1883 RepID=UPI0010120F0F|nr:MULTISPECIES: hypothetical protein [unclassified Streptomyces]MDT0425351.1 hypothetical protein [Streptomyces sp. DSM 41859]WEH28275.1 hypothetical protein P0D76_13530 [Streptomyces sp. AM 3-1-1]
MVLGVGCLAFAILGLITGAAGAGPVFAVFLAGAGVAGLLYGFATSITLTDDRVIVRNFGLTEEVMLTDVVRVDVGYGGTSLFGRDGAKVRAFAVEKPNYAAWMGRVTRADRVKKALLDAAKIAQRPS